VTPGIVVALASLLLIDFDTPDFKLFETFDWIGLIFMALFLGALEYVLEDGPRYGRLPIATSRLAACFPSCSASACTA
jgi:hypothetical protein